MHCVRSLRKKSKKPKIENTNNFRDQKKLKSLKNRLSSIESKIATLEKEIADIDHELLMNYDATIAKPGFFENYQGKKEKLDKLMKNWEDLTVDLEKHT